MGMFSPKFLDYFRSPDAKMKILVSLIKGEKELKDVKYLSLYGSIDWGRPNMPYKMISEFEQYFDTETVNIGYLRSGTIVDQELKIVNGKCTRYYKLA